MHISSHNIQRKLPDNCLNLKAHISLSFEPDSLVTSFHFPYFVHSYAYELWRNK